MREITCIVCPTGCRLLIDENAMRVSGNRCPRGLKYGIEEMTSPKRTVTSTVRVMQRRTEPSMTSDGASPLLQSESRRPLVDFFCDDMNYIEGRLPVRTRDDIPKEQIESVMQAIHQCVVMTPVHMDDVIVDNIADTGIALIATRTILKV